MKDILQHFAIANEVAEPEPLKIGIINDSYVVRAKKSGEKSYFLQRINHHIFQNVEGLQQNIYKVTKHIRQKLEAAGRRISHARYWSWCRPEKGSCITGHRKGTIGACTC